jgi:hypothetical protein
MSPGLLVAWVITVFGMIAGGAIAASSFVATLQPQAIALWIVFIFCIGAGITTGLTLAVRTDAGPLMSVTGYFLIVLGLGAGGIALAILLNIVAGGLASLQLWLLFAGCLPVGILLAYSGGAMAKLDPAAQRE